MIYFNQFHKESVERCLRKIAESKSLQINCEEESQKAQEMHRRLRDMDGDLFVVDAEFRRI